MNKRPFGRGSGPRTYNRPPSARSEFLQTERDAARNRTAEGGLQWKRMDLHIHTPASSDYRDPGITYLDILKKAEEKGLDIIAFADHNSVGGFAAMHREIETLTLLERLDRLTEQEKVTLNEYRRLLDKIVVLPAFEFTATFGFHILGIFPENTSTRRLEHLLLNLNVPEEKMVMGAPDAGSTSDVLAAYQAITAAGGMAIAAHANSSNGVAMQGFPFGGQTKIAYTQDQNLVALEVTDLESTGRRTTASFYDGTKTEYPRRMHCIQGSDAHSLDTEQADSFNKRLGVGARITEMLVSEASFAGIKEVLTGDDFTRTRPYRTNPLWQQVETARQQGPSATQSFHERAITRTSRTRPILHDVIGFANRQGGTIYVGANPDVSVPLHGLEHLDEDLRILMDEVKQLIEPQIKVEFEIRQNERRGIIVITVPKGTNPPYVFTPTGQIYLRYETESALARRDDIVRLVLDASKSGGAQLTGSREQTGVIAAGEPVSALPAVPAPAQPQRTGREVTRTSPGAPAAQEENRREERFTSRTQRPEQDEQEAPAREQRVPPTAAPRPERAVSPALLRNLPPEKIKGQIKPMALPVDAPAVEESPTEPAQLAPAEQDRPPVASDVEETQPEQAPEAKPARASRGRGRRKSAEETPEAALAQPEDALASGSEALPVPEVIPAEPMEATVAAEHLTREEIVTRAEKPKRGRRKTAPEEKQLEIDAPTAAAAASDAGAEAILVEAEVEPGVQLPADIEQPQKKGRGRRKSAAQKAA
ncbi:MAG TPA: RNA-binding domain-containing protein [Chloroflexia bacterium]|nr:RNA-binding domain-containing protein [Chloroflexia bacterium]